MDRYASLNSICNQRYASIVIYHSAVVSFLWCIFKASVCDEPHIILIMILQALVSYTWCLMKAYPYMQPVTLKMETRLNHIRGYFTAQTATYHAIFVANIALIALTNFLSTGDRSDRKLLVCFFSVCSRCWTGNFHSKSRMFKPIPNASTFYQTVRVIFPAAISATEKTASYLILHALAGPIYYAPICGKLLADCEATGSRLLDLGTTAALWLAAFYVELNGGIMEYFFGSKLMKKVDLPVASQHMVTLKDALTAPQPLLRYLAYSDFASFTLMNEQKRRDLLALTFPGGRAAAWKATLDVILQFLKEGTAALSLSSAPKAKRKSSEKSSQDFIRLESTGTITSDETLRRFHLKIDDETAAAADQNVFQSYLKTFKLAAYFTTRIGNPGPYLAANYEMLRLASYGLANAAVAAKTEDEYGVLQRDLREIIEGIAALFKAVHLFPVNSSSSLSGNGQVAAAKRALIDGLKTSMYKVSVGYKDYIADLGLSEGGEFIFKNFAEFKY